MTANPENDNQIKSKSQRKREMTALQDLGDKLVKMPDAVLARIELPDVLRDAVDQARKIKAREGLRRQMQYIGRLMREVDAEAVRRSVEAVELRHRGDVRAFHDLERWRERLIEEGDPAVDAFVSHYPDADRQRLRQLTRSARREQGVEGASRSARLLFRYLRDIQENQA